MIKNYLAQCKMASRERCVADASDSSTSGYFSAMRHFTGTCIYTTDSALHGLVCFDAVASLNVMLMSQCAFNQVHEISANKLIHMHSIKGEFILDKKIVSG